MADSYKKDKILKKIDFSEPWDQKKWIPHSICNKNHCVLAENFFSKIVLKIIVQFLPFWWLFKNVSFCQPYEKVHILKKRNFLQPWDQKKWIPPSICNKNHYILGEKNFQIVLKIIVRFLPFWWLFKNVSFCQPYVQVHILKKNKHF